MRCRDLLLEVVNPVKIDFVKALTWPSREAGSYVKVAVLTVFWMILIGIPLCLGYLVDSIKQVGEGEDDKMPNLEDFVGLLYKGVMLLLIGAIYGAIPLGILFTTFSGGVLTMLGSAFMGSASGAAGGLGHAGTRSDAARPAGQRQGTGSFRAD